MNIFISNLNYRLTSDDLHDLFSEYGDVQSAKIINDRETGRSRGFGFVEMSDDEANTAIEELNQREIDGKVINVAEARPKDDRPRNNFRRNY
ncbi:RNA-binding protein [Apibacter muscae]|uniref:RNA-binding protein n=1 Tax=Apibacter muscae TaxID=2509004 RepID=A0A563DAT8_9FLAO|nr:RNA-binding protein [Apibacter muscae]TWP23247.1 RNA-binding protein [Apibacter muscae]TWP27326.1 RNA-binding protein [Apibacter muscae]TWP28547.1 RNA-binding protein [Apibacter muscae]